MITSEISRSRINLFVPVVLCLFAFGSVALAGSAQWDSAPASNDWNTATNWTPDTVPNGPSDIATFDLSNATAIGVSVDATEVDGIVFNAAASPYAITANTGIQFIMSGSGITNNSGTTQTFIAQAATTSISSKIRFRNNASAGNLTAFIAEGATIANRRGGMITIALSASAGDGMFVNNGGGANGFTSGETAFFGNATAANGTFTNNGGAADGAFGGRLEFFASSSAGHGTFNNNGATVVSTSYTAFAEGHTVFWDTASAANGTFNNNGSMVSDAAGGETELLGNSTAGNGVFNNNPAPVSGVSAAGTTGFGDYATGGDGIFYNEGANFSGMSPGSTTFADLSNAGNGTFINKPGTVSGASGGQVRFFGYSADTATFTNNGASVSGARGGSTTFYGYNAATATFIAYGGVNGGEGGSILFPSGIGDTSRIEVFGNGKLDISGRSGADLGVGSIEGDGNVFLGSSSFSVGSNNLSTVFSGIAQDGGESGGTGASLTKTGTGTLTLSGTNSYTGTTTVSAGTLIVNGSIATGVTVNGGTFGGSGTIGSITVNSGGRLSPGNTSGILNVQGNMTLMMGATYLVDLNGSGLGTNVSGDVNLQNAMLALSLGFTPPPGTTFTIINNGGSGPVTGTFNRLPQDAKVKARRHKFRISYTGGDGNDVVLTTIH